MNKLGDIERFETGILKIPDFLPKERCEELLEALKSHRQWVSLKEYDRDKRETMRSVSVSKCFSTETWEPRTSFEQLQQLVTASSKLKLSGFSQYGASRYCIGDFLGAHRDTDSLLDKRLVTFVAYLNEDFVGGELRFPHLGIHYKPIAGDLVVFLSIFIHLVTPVKQGERYNLTWFGL